mgnify:CR=1 FL=1
MAKQNKIAFLMLFYFFPLNIAVISIGMAPGLKVKVILVSLLLTVPERVPVIGVLLVSVVLMLPSILKILLSVLVTLTSVTVKSPKFIALPV